MIDIAKYVIHAPQFIVTWSIFFGCGIITYVTYAIANGHKFAFRELYDHCVPINVLTNASFHADLKIYVISKLTEGFLLLPVIYFNTWMCMHVSDLLRTLFGSPSIVEFGFFASALCTISMFFVIELSDYFCHYVQHKVPFMWEFHKVHHSAQSLNPLTSKRGHPFALLFEGFVRSLLTGSLGGLFVYLYGITVVEALALSLVASKIFVIATLDPLKHSHHAIGLGAFDRVLISPHMHQVHHSKIQDHWDKNFGTNLSIFDWIFRTGYKPRPGEEVVYGISGYSEDGLRKYNTLYGAYVMPIIRSYKKIKGSPAQPSRIAVAAKD